MKIYQKHKTILVQPQRDGSISSVSINRYVGFSWAGVCTKKNPGLFPFVSFGHPPYPLLGYKIPIAY